MCLLVPAVCLLVSPAVCPLVWLVVCPLAQPLVLVGQVCPQLWPPFRRSGRLNKGVPARVYEPMVHV